VFLRRLVRHEALLAGELDTGFIARHAAILLAPTAPMPANLLATAVARCFDSGKEGQFLWSRRDGWRLQGDAEIIQRWEDGVAAFTVALKSSPRGVSIRVDDGSFEPAPPRSQAFAIRQDAAGCVVHAQGDVWHLRRGDPYAPATADAAGENRLSAPIPGRIVQLLAAPGDAVTKGQLLAVMEAMKTEIKILAPRAGVIAHCGCVMGESVEEGTELFTLAE